MKFNRLFSLVLMTLFSMPLFSKSGIKVVSGDISVIKDPDITATVIFDYTDLMIEGKPYMEHLKSRGSDFVRDWPKESTTSEAYFIKCWNHDNKQGLQVTSSFGNNYKMVFVVNDMDMGSGAASMLVGFGAGGAKMSGMMYILKDDSKVPVLTVSIENQSGRSGMTELVRRTDLYGELAEDLAETLQKAKQSKVPPSEKAVSIPSMETKSASTVKSVAKTSQSSSTKSGKNDTTQNSGKKKVSAATSTVKKSKSVPQPKASVKHNDDLLAEVKGEDVPRRRKPVLGDFKTIADEKTIGLYLDFSDAEIMNRSEDSFVRYMRTSAGRKDLDKDFPNTWENDIKPELLSLFSSKVNEELKDEKIRLRLVERTDLDYVLKLDVIEVDDDGNNTINFLFVNMMTGEVEAQIKCESKGGHVGRFVGLIQQGFESAAENFTKLFIDQID